MAWIRRRVIKGRTYLIVVSKKHEYGARTEELAREMADRLTGLEVAERIGLPPTEGYIYFAQADGGGPIKIGFTRRDPGARVRAINTGNPETLRIVASFPATEAMEKQIHLQLEGQRLYGEWFRDCKRLRNAIEYFARSKRPRRRGGIDGSQVEGPESEDVSGGSGRLGSPRQEDAQEDSARARGSGQ